MKGKFSLVGAVVAVALAVGASTAPAEPGPSSDWFERAVAAENREAGATPYVDAFERPDTASSTAISPDWFERTAAAAVRDVGARPYVDAFERPEVTSAQSTAPISADSDPGRAWFELGIAFAIGLTLALSLVAVVRLRPNRPLAQ